jgi:hypothetical protein
MTCHVRLKNIFISFFFFFFSIFFSPHAIQAHLMPRAMSEAQASPDPRMAESPASAQELPAARSLDLP